MPTWTHELPRFPVGRCAGEDLDVAIEPVQEL